MNKVRMSCAALLLAACSIAVAGAQQSAILERIIVKVNGEILTQTQLENKQIEELQSQNKRIENRKDLSTEEVKKALLEITPALLVEQVNDLLLVQRARELNIKYSEEEFKRNIENIKKQNPDTIKTEADLVRALKEAGLTMETLRQNFETAYLKYVVEQREIARNITLTEQEAREYYKTHPQEFMKPATVTLREILVSVPTQGTGSQATFNAAIQESAKTKIDAIRARDCGRRLSEVDCRGVGFRNQGQRWTHWPGRCGRAQSATRGRARKNEARRHHRAAANPRGIPNLQARHAIGG